MKTRKLSPEETVKILNYIIDLTEKEETTPQEKLNAIYHFCKNQIFLTNLVYPLTEQSNPQFLSGA